MRPLQLPARARPALIEQLCDRLLPADAQHPGAVALGLHLRFIRLAEGPSGMPVLRTLGERLAADGFADADAAEQERILAGHLAGRRGAHEVTAGLRLLLQTLAALYYAHPASWGSLGYRRPQPGGYPEFDAHGRAEP